MFRVKFEIFELLIRAKFRSFELARAIYIYVHVERPRQRENINTFALKLVTRARRASAFLPYLAAS